MVAVTGGHSIRELTTRARTHLSVILVDDKIYYKNKIKTLFQQAAELGLVDMVQLSAVEISQGDDEANMYEEEKEIEDKPVAKC